jgi:hypothetical protein
MGFAKGSPQWYGSRSVPDGSRCVPVDWCMHYTDVTGTVRLVRYGTAGAVRYGWYGTVRLCNVCNAPVVRRLQQQLWRAQPLIVVLASRWSFKDWFFMCICMCSCGRGALSEQELHST